VLILCPTCNGPLPDWLLRTSRTESLCPACNLELTVELFPAVFRQRAAVDAGALTLAEGEACCYEHATKRAVSVCNQCGRFLCALCEVEVDGAVWCPGCLQLDKPAAQVNTLERHRTLYDSIALALAIWPIFAFFYPVIFSAPIVLFLAVRHWKTPSSLIPRNKWRFIAAVIIAALQLAFIAFLVVSLIWATRRSMHVR